MSLLKRKRKKKPTLNEGLSYSSEVEYLLNQSKTEQNLHRFLKSRSYVARHRLKNKIMFGPRGFKEHRINR